MKVSHVRPETPQEKMRRFKADKTLAHMNKQIATIKQLVGDAEQRIELVIEDRDRYIKENYPDIADIDQEAMPAGASSISAPKI
jgi:hypothetical protein